MKGPKSRLTFLLSDGIQNRSASRVTKIAANIASTRQPQFICGARVEEFYIMMMQALGIGPVCAVVTYAGIANFSFTTNGDLVPDAQELADGLQNELRILLRAATDLPAGGSSTGKKCVD